MKGKMFFLMTLFVLSCNVSRAQNGVTYNYDKGGNLVQRKVNVLMNLRTKSIEDSISPMAIRVYPNPTSDVLNIDGSLPDQYTSATIALVNMNGQIVRREKYEGRRKEIKISDLVSGIYFLEVICSKKEYRSFKIVISN